MIEEIRRACGIESPPFETTEQDESDELAADVRDGTASVNEHVQEVEIDAISAGTST